MGSSLLIFCGLLNIFGCEALAPNQDTRGVLSSSTRSNNQSLAKHHKKGFSMPGQAKDKAQFCGWELSYNYLSAKEGTIVVDRTTTMGQITQGYKSTRKFRESKFYVVTRHRYSITRKE